MTVALHLLLVSVKDMLILRDHGRLNTSGGAESIQCGFQFLQIILSIVLIVVRHIHLKPLNNAVHFFFFSALEQSHLFAFSFISDDISGPFLYPAELIHIHISHIYQFLRCFLASSPGTAINQYDLVFIR